MNSVKHAQTFIKLHLTDCEAIVLLVWPLSSCQSQCGRVMWSFSCNFHHLYLPRMKYRRLQVGWNELLLLLLLLLLTTVIVSGVDAVCNNKSNNHNKAKTTTTTTDNKFEDVFKISTAITESQLLLHVGPILRLNSFPSALSQVFFLIKRWNRTMCPGILESKPDSNSLCTKFHGNCTLQLLKEREKKYVLG